MIKRITMVISLLGLLVLRSPVQAFGFSEEVEVEPMSPSISESFSQNEIMTPSEEISLFKESTPSSSITSSEKEAPQEDQNISSNKTSNAVTTPPKNTPSTSNSTISKTVSPSETSSVIISSPSIDSDENSIVADCQDKGKKLESYLFKVIVTAFVAIAMLAIFIILFNR